MTLDPLYRPILRQALGLTWRRKSLWFLGFFAAFLGLGGEYEFLANQYANVSSGEWNGFDNFLQFAGPGQDFLSALRAMAADMTFSAWLALLLFLVFIFVMVWMVITAQGALIWAIAGAEQTGRVKILDALKNGYKAFWSLAAIIISTRLLALFVLAVLGLPLISVIFALDESLVSPGAALIFFVLAVPLFILFSLIAKFAVTYRLVAQIKWRSALEKSFVLFADHWLVTVELALIVFLINIAAALLFVLGALLLSVPFLLLGVVAADLFSAVALKAQISAALVLFLLILLILGSALSVFQNAAWTLLFLKIRNKPHTSKLLRIVRGWQEKYG